MFDLVAKMKRMNRCILLLLPAFAVVQADPMQSATGAGLSGDLQVALTQSVQNGDKQALLELCQKGGDVNAIDNFGNCLLKLAVLFQSKPLLEEIIGEFQQAFGGEANVMEAFESEKLSPADANFVGRVISHSAGDQLAVDTFKPHVGYIEPSRQMVEILLQAGADPNIKDPSGFTALHYAIRLGDPVLARMLVDHGADVNAVSIAGVTPLSTAVKKDLTGLVRELLDAGARPGTADADGWSPLHWAGTRGNADVARMLLQHGAPLEARDSAGYTPLNTAAEKGGLAVVELLLEAGADPESESEGISYTPLMSASVHGNTDIVRALLEAGVDIGWATPTDGYTSLMQAAQCARLETLKVLIESGADVNAANTEGATVLHLAIKHPIRAAEALTELVGETNSAGWGPDSDRLEIVRLLLEAGADPNSRNKHDNTPMHYLAINWDSPEAAKLLVDHGAQVDPRGHLDNTPLYNAAANGFIGLVQFFLENGASVSAQDSNLGATALHWAVANNHERVVDLLLTHGADVHLKDRVLETPAMKTLYTGNLTVFKALYETDPAIINTANQSGQTFLHLFATMGYPDAVEFLLGKGMDPNALDRVGQSVLWMACMGVSSKEVFEMRAKAAAMLGQSPASYRDLAKTAFSPGEGFAEVAKLLIEAGAEANFILESSGQTLLNLACNSGNLDVVRVLLENGADANLPAPGSGCYPIHTAADYGQPEVVEFCLQNGVDVNLRTRDGCDPLHYAAYSIFSLPRNYLNVIDVLVDHGANVDAYSNSQWKTPLHSTILQKNTYVAERLIHHGATFSSPDRITGERYFDFAKAQFNKPLVAVMSARRNFTPAQGFHDSIGNEDNIVARIGNDRIHTRDLIAYAGGPDSFFKEYRLSDLENPEKIGKIMDAVHERLRDTAVEFIGMVLMSYASDLAGLPSGDLAVEEKYKQLAEKLGVSTYNLPKELRPLDWTPEDFEKVAQWQARSAKFQSEIIDVATIIPREAVAGYYESVKDRFLSPGRLRLQMIVLKDQLVLKEVLSQLDSGGDFGELAKHYSTHSSGQSGGDLGWSVLEDINKNFLESFTDIVPGAVGSPVQLGGHTYIVRVAELAKPAPAPLEVVADDLEAELMEAARTPIKHQILRILSTILDTEYFIPVPWEN
jgi:ankyrin repeat protein